VKLLRHGPGCRTPQTLLLIDERDVLLRLSSGFHPGCSDREVARRLRTALLRYQTGRWRRDRSELTCPPQHAGKLIEVLWMLLRVRDHVPSEMTIRRALRYL
jgi:hypothetical protein